MTSGRLTRPSVVSAAALAAGVVLVACLAAAPEADHIADLRQRHLLIPVEGVRADQLVDTFNAARAEGRRHDAIDILAPRHTPVVAVEDGSVEKLFTSKLGGLTVYEFDPTRTYVYYYAHLDGYAAGLREHARVTRGQLLGYVGTTGNAPKDTPHLHFEVSVLTPAKQWWTSTAVDPFLIWRDKEPSPAVVAEARTFRK